MNKKNLADLQRNVKKKTEELCPWQTVKCAISLFGASFPAGPLQLTVLDMFAEYDCKNETAAESNIKATVKNTSA